jgi:hypothetical protein
MYDFQKAILWAITAWWQFFQAAVQTPNLIKLQLLIEYEENISLKNSVQVW